MSSKLTLHAGAAVATLAQIADVPTPAPTETWFPIPHLLMIEQFKAALAGANLTIVEETYALGRAGQRLFGMMEVRNGSQALDYALMVGLRNSHDQSYPAAGVAGSRVFVCDNLAFSGEVKFGRKHTKFIERDLLAVVTAGVGKLLEHRVVQEQRIAAYKEFGLDDRTVNDFLIRSMDARVIPTSKIDDVLAQWRKPNYDDFKPRTAWSLFNGYTEVLKGGIMQLPQRTQKLHTLMDGLVGLTKITATVGVAEGGEVIEAVDYEIVDDRQN